MPIISGGGGGGGAPFNGGTITNPLIAAMDTVGEVPLKLQPAATDTSRDLVEFYDPTGAILGWVDATGSLDIEPASVAGVTHILKGNVVRLRNGSQSSYLALTDGSPHELSYVTGGGLKVISDDHGAIVLVSDNATDAVLITNQASSTNALDVKGHTGSVILQARDDGNVVTPNIPTADPHIVGAIYSAAGTLHISAG